MSEPYPISGKFGRWTVVNPNVTIRGKRRHALCKCECGTVRAVSRASLKNGHTNNKRNNVWVEFQGSRKTIAQWARGITYAVLQVRLKKGWSAERALTTPVRKDRRHAKEST